MMNLRLLALPATLLALTALVAHGHAQQAVHDLFTLNGKNTALGLYSESVANVGDLDGDAFDDVAAGSRYNSVNPSGDGSVFLFSGRTRALLAVIHGKTPSGYFGDCVKALGDVDKDGVHDVGIGAPRAPMLAGKNGPGMVFVYSGKTRKLIHTISAPTSNAWGFGTTMAGLGDIDGDSYPDFAVGAPGDNNRGKVYVYSGQKAKLLYVIVPLVTTGQFGAGLVPLPDMDSDGTGDLAILALGASIASSSVQGPIWIHSGKTGKLIRTIVPTPTHGIAAAKILRGIDDVDGDKLPDLIVGFPDYYNAPFYYGQVQIYSSGTGKLLTNVSNFSGSLLRGFGSTFAGLPDSDGDGSPELLIGDYNLASGRSGRGVIHVYSAKTGKLVETITSPKQDQHSASIGRGITFLGDLNRDGNWDFSSYYSKPVATPRELLILSVPALDLSTDTKAISIFKGGKAAISIHAGPKHAKDLVMMIGSASGSYPGMIVSGRKLHLNLDSYLSFTVGAPHAVFFNNLSQLDVNGNGGVGFVLPSGLHPSLAGTILSHSCILIGSGGLDFANLALPLEITLF